jgi:4-amino-4-deoxy-L-arabinose transferase-like glycosyltransferase
VSHRRAWGLALGAVLLLALALRLRGLHDPMLDHPGWRQGDTAAIARNFATLDMNPLHPQTDYDGPPPNYVELELQIVPFVAASLYKVFGIHEVFGRLISIAFSLGTVAMLAYFARWLFGSEVAGIAAAALFAIYPGSVYYGRSFTPDTTMVFFLTAALFASARFFLESDARSWRGFWAAGLLGAAAILAKPVAAVALVPIVAMSAGRFGLAGTLRRPHVWALLAVAVVPYLCYDAYLSRIAEWHWASGITKLHVLPSLALALSSPAAFVEKLKALRSVFGMLWTTMLGPFGLGLFALAIFVPAARRARPLLFGWLVAALLYAYAVVTVERVDYYLYLVLPLAALWTGAALARAAEMLPPTRDARLGAAGVAALALGLIANDGRHRVAPYYAYNKSVYRAAKALDATLAPGALVVMGHYDPSVLYYIGRKGWEEDPYLWTPFDEQSAIRKGARYFIAIEENRFKRNVELYAWMQRFPVQNPDAKWPVYETDPAKVLPGAEERWNEFRRREKAGELPKTSAPPVPPSG